MFLPLLLLFLIAIPGFLLYIFKKVSSSVLNTLLALWAGSMLSIALIHILPESLEANHYAIFAFLGWFLFLYVIEEFVTPHMHDHSHGDHSHEDPHEHSHHIAIVTFIALVFHTLFDGVAVRAGFEISEAIGYSLIVVVALHQVPVSLSLVAILWNTWFTRKMQVFLVILFALSAPLWYFLSDTLFHLAHPLTIVWLVAFAWGSLLYVSTVDLMPLVHSQKRMKYISLFLFLLGSIGVSLITLFEQPHVHSHEEMDGSSFTHQSEEVSQ